MKYSKIFLFPHDRKISVLYKQDLVEPKVEFPYLGQQARGLRDYWHWR